MSRPIFKILFSLLFVAFGVQAYSQVISSNSTEVLFSYSAEFTTSSLVEPWGDAYDHHNYLFGVMHSPELTDSMGVDSSLIEGIGSPRSDVDITVEDVEETDGGVRIRYKIKGRMLLHNTVASNAIAKGSLALPLPLNLDNIYIKKCTDPHYTGFGDYWYFWNPYREGCTKLQDAPYSEKVEIAIKPTRERKIEQTPRLDLLRGSNANGDLFSVYIVHGFDGSSLDPKDDARQNVADLHEYLTDNGFEEEVRRSGMIMPLSVFTKKLTLPSGKTIQVEVRSLLVNTAIESKTVTFPQFFKEAVETADVIFYTGHSGLGGNLDIAQLEANAKQGRFKFPKNKRQLFFFDSCSSYSYYLVPFSEKKTRARIDVVTNALASYFHTGGIILKGFLDVLFDEKINDITWLEYMNKMEEPLGGETYLMSVGGI